MVVKLHGPRIFEPDSLFPHWDLGKNPIMDDLRFLVSSDKVALGSAALKLPHQFKPTSPLRLVPQPPPLRPMPMHPLAATLLVLMGAYEVYSNWRGSKTPTIDKPPEGKDVARWIDDMKTFGLIAAEIATLQQQIRLMDEWGLGVWNYESKDRLEQLFARAQTIAHDTGMPITSGALKMVASADGGDATPSAISSQRNLTEEIDRALQGLPFTTHGGESDDFSAYSFDNDVVTKRLQETASGARHYPRLEALLEVLLRDRPNPVIVERGPGSIADLGVVVARNHPITLVGWDITWLNYLIRNMPIAIQTNIQTTEPPDAPDRPADLTLWIHPDPNLAFYDGYLDTNILGKHVAPGGFLVVVVEDGFGFYHRRTPGWTFVYKGHGPIAPTLQTGYPSILFVLQHTIASQDITPHIEAGTFGTWMSSLSADDRMTVWETIVAHGDYAQYARAGQQRLETLELMILRFINLSKTSDDYSEEFQWWWEGECGPEIDYLMDTKPSSHFTAGSRSAVSAEMDHNLRHRITMLYNVMRSHFKDTNDPEQFHRTEAYFLKDRSLTAAISKYGAAFDRHFGTRASVVGGDYSVVNPEFRTPLNLVLNNLLLNAAYHTQANRSTKAITVTLTPSQIIVSDPGDGMDPITLEALQNQQRVSDGVLLAASDFSTLHGRGWEFIWRECNAMGITPLIESKRGEGTTVTLKLPEGFLKR